MNSNDESQSNFEQSSSTIQLINNNINGSVPPPRFPPPPPPSNFNQTIFRPKLQKFNGIDKSVTIENWLKLYEASATRYNWSANEMLSLLGEYLEKEALNFYLDCLDSSDWNTIKIKLNTRFGVKTTEPIVEFDRLKFYQTKDVDDYFEKKRAGLADLSESHAVALMIEHLSDDLKRCFIGHQAKLIVSFSLLLKLLNINFLNILTTTIIFIESSIIIIIIIIIIKIINTKKRNNSTINEMVIIQATITNN